MPARHFIVGALIVTAAVAAGAIAFHRPHDQTAAFAVPAATPPGVTLQRIYVGPMLASGIANGKLPVARPVFADAEGRPAYLYDRDMEPGKSACSDACAQAWLPLSVAANAKAAGDWSIVTRGDGSKQWAYRGHPLYVSAKDKPFGQATANGADDAWHVALFSPEDGLDRPEGIGTRDLPKANGVGLVDEHEMTLYVSDSTDTRASALCEDADCSYRWKPVPAAEIARPIGEFSVVSGLGGTPQWAYRGRPLFTFDGDQEPGDANGEQTGKHWHAALIVRYFMPDGIEIRPNHFGGENLATNAGKTIYVRDRSSYMQGHSQRRGVPLVAAAGRQIGLSACDAACAKSWPPVKAPADAQPSGFWDVATRDDGTKQWVYMGYPLFTYTGDKKPGDINGYDIYEFQPGEDPLKTVAMPPMMPHGSAALVWRQASP